MPSPGFVGHRRSFIAAATGALFILAACAKSSNPVSPSSSTGPKVTVSASPLPVPTELRGTAIRANYLVRGDVLFRETAGRTGRLTQMTLVLVNAQGQGEPMQVALDLALPANGVVTQSVSALLDTLAIQGAFQLQISAVGTDEHGRAFSVPSVQLPVTSGGGDARSMPFRHVFVLVEENAGMEEAAVMPYLQSLASQYATATQYYANTHPSNGNYFMMTTGEIVSNDTNFNAVVSNDNVVRQLLAAGKTWKSYAEDLPSVGYTGGDKGLYAKRHNPLAHFSDVAENGSQAMNLVPFTQFAADLSSYSFPNYSFIVPNLCHDGHDCPLATADAWLQSNIAPLVSSTQFQRDGLLIVLFDEATDADRRHGGGRVGWVAVSGRSKRGYRSTALYQHESTLRLTLEALGVNVFPGRAAGAPDMSEFFNP